MPEADAPAVTPLEGKTTLDDKVSFEPTRLSYRCAERLAARIADAIASLVNGRKVVVAGVPFLTDLANFNALGATLDGLRKDYESLEASAQRFERLRLGIGVDKKSGAAPLPADLGEAANLDAKDAAAKMKLLSAPVLLGVQTALGLVSLLRSDVEYVGAMTVIDPLAFELGLAVALQRKKAEAVFVPELAVVSPTAAGGSLVNRIERVQKAKRSAWAAIAPTVAELARLDVELVEAEADKDQRAVDRLAAQQAVLHRELDPISEPLSRADQRLSELWSQWDKVDEHSGLTVFARLLRAEALNALAPVYVHATVVASGGHHRVSRSLWRTMFSGDGLSAMGGAIVRWAVLGSDGTVLEGGIMADRESATFPPPPKSETSFLSRGDARQPDPATPPKVEKPPDPAEAGAETMPPTAVDAATTLPVKKRELESITGKGGEEAP